MQVLYMGRAPHTKETLPDFLKWRRVIRPPLVFRGLTGSQRTPGFWGVIVLVYGPKRPFLLRYESRDTRHINFPRLTGSQLTPRFWGASLNT